jgi:hypothetical protein
VIWLSILKDAIRQHRERAAAKRDADERASIAKAFNDRYTYRVRLDDKSEKRATNGPWGLPLQLGFAWMCPQCNRVHEPTEWTLWTGLQYPACCSRPAGHRINERIRTS